MNADELHLFLYRDLVLFWEHDLSAHTDWCSQRSNRGLAEFLKHSKIQILAVASASVPKEFAKLAAVPGLFVCTASAANLVASLMQHLRNSAAHGLFEVIHRTAGPLIRFEDRRSGTTMVGSISLRTLRELVRVIRDHGAKQKNALKVKKRKNNNV